MRDDKSGHVPRTSEQARGDRHRDWHGGVRGWHPAAPDPELAQHGHVVEGVIDHHVLDIHHVRDLPEHVPAYDWAFLLVAGVGIVILGWVLATQRTEAR